MRFLFLLFFLLAFNAYAADWQESFNRYVHNFKTSEYGGDSQVWSIDSNGAGFIFMAAGTRLVVWDGSIWENYTVDDVSVIRNLRYDSLSGKLYCAGDNFFGYWERDRYGDMVFRSLYKNSDLSRNEIFWKIIPSGDIIYLQTHDALFLFREDELVMLRTADVGYLFNIGDEVYCQLDGELCMITGSEIISLSARIDDRIIMLTRDCGHILCLAEASGFMILDESGKFVPYDSFEDVNSRFSKQRVFTAAVSCSGDYLVGTVLDGMYIVDAYGNIKEHYGAEQGLKYTTVLSVFEAGGGDIYIGSDGGMAVIENDTGVRYFHPVSSRIGYVYTSALFNGSLYIGTNKGLYRVEDNDAVLVDGSQGQIWDLIHCGEELAVIEDKGLYVLDMTARYRKLFSGVWCMTAVSGRKNYFCASDNQGIILLEKNSDGSLKMRNRLLNYDNPNNSIIFDKYGYMWVDELRGHVRRLSVDVDLSAVNGITDYKVGTNEDAIIRACKVDGEVLFVSGDKCYTYSPYKDSVIVNGYYTELFSRFDSDELLITQAGNHFFNYSDNSVDEILRNGTEVRVRRDIFSSTDLDHLPRRFRRLSMFNDSTLMCGFSEYLGMVPVRNDLWHTDPDVLILNISCNYKGEECKLPVGEDILEFPYGAVDLRIRVCAFPVGSLMYRLDGGGWIPVSDDNSIIIKYIRSGRHLLEIGCDGSVAVAQNIYIRRHFTASWWFISCVFLILLLLSYAGLYIYRRRVAKLRSQYEMIRQNEILSLELKERSKKLSIMSLNEMNVNNMLNDILKHLDQVPAEETDSRKLKAAKRCVEKYMRENGNWKTFEIYFNSIFDGFFDKLSEAYPKLTGNDLKICAYVKLGMSTKEIAAMMNIEVSSAESARYRLRKNMGLSPSDSLTEVLSKI